MVCENTDSVGHWCVCFLDWIWTCLVVFAGALISVSIPVLLLVLCIIVLAGESSGNTSIHISTDFYYWYKNWEYLIRIWALISGGTLLLMFVSILVLILAFVCILVLVLILLSIWMWF